MIDVGSGWSSSAQLTHVEAHAWLTEQWEQLLLLVPAASADDEGPPPGQ